MVQSNELETPLEKRKRGQRRQMTDARRRIEAKVFSDKSIEKIEERLRDAPGCPQHEFCEKCGDKLREHFPIAICPQHGVVQTRDEPRSFFCNVCGKRLKFQRQHYISDLLEVLEITYVYHCRSCGHRVEWRRKIGMPGIHEKFKKWRSEYRGVI